MAAISSTKTGNWSDPTVWSGGVVPGSSDDVTVAQSHIVTVDVSSAAKTVAVTTASNAATTRLVVNSTLNLSATSGTALSYSGAYNDVPLTMLNIGPGGLIVANHASGQTVTFAFGLGGYSNTAWGATGTGWGSGQFAEILNSGAGTLTITSSGLALTSNYTGSYLKLTGVNGGLTAYTGGYTGSGWIADHLRCDGCGIIAINGDGPSSAFRFHDVQFFNSIDATYSATIGIGDPSGGVERTNDLVTYDKRLGLTSKGFSFTRTGFLGGPPGLGAGITWTTMDGCLFRFTGSGAGSGDMNCAGPITNSYALYTDNTENPHWFQFSTSASTDDVPTWIISGNIFDGPMVSDTGDEGETVVPPSDRPVTYTYNLIVPTVSGDAAGRGSSHFVACGGGDGLTLTAEHNTVVGSLAFPAFYFGESTPAHTGMFASIRANLVADLANVLSGSLISGPYTTGVMTADVVSASNATNNGGYNLATGPDGVGYSGVFSTGTPGAGDVHANPNFVDPTRNFPTWAISQGSTGSTITDQITDGLAYVHNDPTLIAGLMSWVRAGFRPTNASFSAASYSGDASTADAAWNTWPGGAPGIGAMAYQAASLPPVWATFGAGVFSGSPFGGVFYCSQAHHLPESNDEHSKGHRTHRKFRVHHHDGHGEHRRHANGRDR